MYIYMHHFPKCAKYLTGSHGPWRLWLRRNLGTPAVAESLRLLEIESSGGKERAEDRARW